jgi:hypothetical protein
MDLESKVMGFIPIWAVLIGALYYFKVWKPKHEAN